MHAAERHHAWNPAAGTHDDLAADLLAQDPVRRAHVIGSFGRHGGRLEPEAVLADRSRGLVDDAVPRGPAALEGEVEADEVELDSDHVGRESPESLFQELLPGLVAFEHDDRLHRADPTGGSTPEMISELSGCALR